MYIYVWVQVYIYIYIYKDGPTYKAIDYKGNKEQKTARNLSAFYAWALLYIS